MSILNQRDEWEPFEYPQAYDYWMRHQYSYWNHTKVNFAQDIQDWKLKLNDKQRNLVGNTLKAFTQTELVVGKEYWSSRVVNWFPKPEIQAMALEFSAREMIHTISYSQIDINLGLKDYKGFLQDPVTKAKLDSLIMSEKTLEDRAVSLAVFSAFTEGVNLFSSFAILLNFKRFNLLPAIGQIIAYSVLDEGEHSKAGCWLFKTLCEEKNLWSSNMKKRIYEAARMSVKLEDDFLDKAFELGDVEGLTKHEMKNFIRARANQKLVELGLKTNWKNLDYKAVQSVDEWFSLQTGGESDSDFFFKRVTGAYAKGNKNWGKIWS